MSTKMNTKNKHFSYENTDSLHWGNPAKQLQEEKRSYSQHLFFPPPLPSTDPLPPNLLPAQGPSTWVGSALLSLCASQPQGGLCPPNPSLHPSLKSSSPGSWALDSVASSPSPYPPNLCPAHAQRPWPQGGRLRPHPAPSPAPSPTQPRGLGEWVVNGPMEARRLGWRGGGWLTWAWLLLFPPLPSAGPSLPW